ncbi:MAG: glycerol-3-phosphate 1-O-acyltransferase PlsY [Bacteroides sp.]|nr:glycerol-3-phosphate 1-O-acyltransferase PlsY [Bacteroides sp.]MCM1548936.1 glycerol-3-phosphate 1-O-acyltransferase PlsY [Clostridium sp.]
MGEFILCLLVGYLLGCISPSYFLSRSKGVDLRSTGQQNLGTTNAFMVLGKASGIIVMVIDFMKGFLAVKMAQLLFPEFAIAGITAGAAAILGHIFPFYLKFRGGKGLATLGGLILSTDWRIFLLLAVIGIVVMLVSDWGCAASFSTAILYPFFYFMKGNSYITLVILEIACLCVVVKHCANIPRLQEGKEPSVRMAIRKVLHSVAEEHFTEL